MVLSYISRAQDIRRLFSFARMPVLAIHGQKGGGRKINARGVSYTPSGAVASLNEQVRILCGVCFDLVLGTRTTKRLANGQRQLVALPIESRV